MRASAHRYCGSMNSAKWIVNWKRQKKMKRYDDGLSSLEWIKCGLFVEILCMITLEIDSSESVGGSKKPFVDCRITSSFIQTELLLFATKFIASFELDLDYSAFCVCYWTASVCRRQWQQKPKRNIYQIDLKPFKISTILTIIIRMMNDYACHRNRQQHTNKTDSMTSQRSNQLIWLFCFAVQLCN